MLTQLKQQAQHCKHRDADWWVSNVLAKHVTDVSLADAEHILDYFDAVAGKKRIKKMSFNEALKQSKAWTEKLKKRGRGVAESDEDIEVVLEYPNGTRWVRLKTKLAYEREGNLMSHCVASYYNRDCEIYSLRDVRNNPHCTVEINKNVNQIKGKGNGSIHPNYIRYVLDFLKSQGKEVRHSEMENLGYIPLSDETWKLLAARTKGAKELTVNGTRYFYVHSQLEIKVGV